MPGERGAGDAQGPTGIRPPIATSSVASRLYPAPSIGMARQTCYRGQGIEPVRQDAMEHLIGDAHPQMNSLIQS